MIDGMVTVLSKEQEDDDAQKSFCSSELEKSAAEATEQRKSEHAAFVQAQAENQAATALVEKAKNRLFKVYRPGLYKEEARRELTEEERILVNSGQPDHSDAEYAEETAQKDYETLMAASQKSREQMAESITEKESANAEWGEKIEVAKTEQASTTDALAKLKELIAGLHAECDFLLENYDTRKEARTNEVEGLKNAKAVLSGASFA